MRLWIGVSRDEIGRKRNSVTAKHSPAMIASGVRARSRNDVGVVEEWMSITVTLSQTGSY